jgi:signal transduction histidine kinase
MKKKTIFAGAAIVQESAVDAESPKKKDFSVLANRLNKALLLVDPWILPVVLILAWHITTAVTKTVAPTLIPPLKSVYLNLVKQLKSGLLVSDLSISAIRVIKGYLVGAGLGIVFGVLMGVSRHVNKMFSGILSGIRQIPPLAWMPLIILWFGIRDVSKVVLVAKASFFPILLNTMEGINADRANEQRLAAENAMLDHAGKIRAEMMSSISHETRTPLAVLSGYAEIIAMELRAKGVDEQHAADLDMIATETQNIAKLMESLQSVARTRAESEGKTQIDFAAVIRQVAKLYEHIFERQKTQLHTDIPEDLPAIYGNAAELTQVLFNLLSNASKHTTYGAVIIKARVDAGASADGVAGAADAAGAAAAEDRKSVV